MDKSEIASLSKQLLDNPIIDTVLNELEQSAIDLCVNADPTDNEKRGAYAAQVRAIRAFRSNLKAKLGDNRAKKGAPA